IIVGSLISLLLGAVAEKITMSSYVQGKWTDSRQIKSAREFQNYVSENNLSTTDLDSLETWSKSHLHVYFYIEKDGNIIYDSTTYELLKDYEEDPLDSDFTEDEIRNLSYFGSYNMDLSSYSISFSDDIVNIYIFGDYSFGLLRQLKMLATIISSAIAICVLLIIIRTKIRYIQEITNGIHILEGGNLDYNIPVKGDDELTQLADSVNAMSNSLIQQIENEKNALMANASLVTALSHDLRTPLTTQMGYLEILKEGRYQSDEEKNHYLDTALNTCREIKIMSDRLFEYFLAFNPNPEKDPENLEEFDGMEVFMQLLAEHTIPLESNGFKVHIIEPEESFLVHINIDDMVRVFNNIFSNIDKYADEAMPILIEIIREGNYCLIDFTNKIRKSPRKNESAKIGLESISALMYRQGGKSSTKTKDGNFIMELKLPVKPMNR
ncbi:MAG: sensor histidine kinase, partial [Lachnospiraceae bacterium]|nr:sensor histidine kinase [Lachnospiraceae bacterium]